MDRARLRLGERLRLGFQSRRERVDSLGVFRRERVDSRVFLRSRGFELRNFRAETLRLATRRLRRARLRRRSSLETRVQLGAFLDPATPFALAFLLVVFRDVSAARASRRRRERRVRGVARDPRLLESTLRLRRAALGVHGVRAECLERVRGRGGARARVVGVRGCAFRCGA